MALKKNIIEGYGNFNCMNAILGSLLRSIYELFNCSLEMEKKFYEVFKNQRKKDWEIVVSLFLNLVRLMLSNLLQ